MRHFEKLQRTIDANPLLSSEEEVQLARRIQEGDEEAVETLVCHNIRFVLRIAGQHRDNSVVSMEDRVQEGLIGLMRAARKFDPGYGH